MEKHPLYNKSPQIKDKIDCLATTFAQCAFSIFLQIFLLFFSSKIKSNFSVLFICVVLSFMLLIRKFWLIKRIAFNVYFNRVHAMNFVVHDVWAGLWYSVDWMGLMLLHWLMMAVADDCVHLNVYEGNAVHLTDGIKMTIVSRNFDLAPNGVSDWIPNVHSLNGKLKNVRLEGSWFISYAFRPHSFLKGPHQCIAVEMIMRDVWSYNIMQWYDLPNKSEYFKKCIEWMSLLNEFV